MAISYLEPLRRAWDRTRQALFSGFDPEKWLVLGLAAFLAGLLDPGLGSGVRTRWNWPVRIGDGIDIHLWGWTLTDNSIWLPLLAPLVLAVLLIALALLWVGSRGKFIFLDSVVRDQAAIFEPWARFKALGDSLFLWRIGFWVFGIVLSALLTWPIFTTLGNVWDRDLQAWMLLPILAMGLVGLMLGLLFAIVALFLESFVIPIMYGHSVTCIEAWRRFWPLLQRHPVELFLYCVVVFVVSLICAALVAALTALTCCILLPFVIIPYVRSVVFLPLTMTLRLYSVEFLNQFGDDVLNLPLAVTPQPEDSDAP